jgi:glycosyltransferase involved in cell wall biosynthesis
LADRLPGLAARVRDLRARARLRAGEAARIPWQAGAGVRRAVARREASPGAEALAALARDALGSGLAAGPVRVLGSGAAEVAAQLAAAGRPATAVTSPGDAVVLLDLHRLAPRASARRLRDVAHAGLVVLLAPLWPAGRADALADGGVRTLRSRHWWTARAAAAGLAPALELRTPAAAARCLVFEPRVPAPAAPPDVPRRPAGRSRPEVVVRIHDDLSLGNSFAWISASIALALADLGVPVSIAPTELSASFDDERRERLRELVERGPAPARVDAEIGWTHFWPSYRRPIGGRVPLALFAINYAFTGRDPAAFDPWLRQLVASEQPLAPISGFCRDVLADAGVADERLRIVPMGVTDGIPGAGAGELPGGRRLRLLHVTNAADVERNGTDLALDAFAAAFAPGDDVTLVVRDYGRFAPELALAAEGLTGRGYDVRYWPVFFPQHRLGRFLGAFDALLAPFRGEGFGIKLLDAMACGVAPIAPFFGGPRDFLDDDSAFRVAHDLAPVREGYDAEQLELGNGPQWARCRPDALAAALRAAYEDPEAVARRGARASERALGGFTWRHTAERIVALLDV